MESAIRRDTRPNPRESRRGEVRAGGIGVGLVTLSAGLHSGNTQIKMKLLRHIAPSATDVLQQHDV